MLDDPGLLYKISTLYYEQNRTQEEIAKEVAISRPMVSRALDKARAMGIVRIQVIAPVEMANLAQRLQDMLGIPRILVVPYSGNGAKDRVTDEVAQFGARLLEKEITGSMNVGFGWGNTVYRTIMNLKMTDNHGSDKPKFVPLLGSVGRTESEFQVNAIVNYAATKLKGEAHYFNVSMLSTSKEQAKSIKDQYSDIYEIWDNLDIAIVGLGPFLPKPSFPFDVYTASQIDYLRANNVKGDMLGRFFNEKGFVHRPETGYIHIGIPEEDLRKTKDVICLCSGVEKIPAIVCASKLKLFTSLVIDYKTASELETVLKEKDK